eukprot:COSAG01_NODE_15408_length_1341_cov_6.170692_1_plen_46_part_10
MRLGTWAKPRRLLESDEGLSEEDLAKLAETIQKDGLPDPRAPPNGG